MPQAVRCGVLALTLCAQLVHAERKTVILSAGDCADPSLVNAAKDFRDAAGKALGSALVEGEVVLDIVRPRPTRSLAELDRQIESGRTLFYGGQADRAGELIERSLEELERATPDAQLWKLTVNALILKALIAKGSDRSKDMAEAFRRIARLDPELLLDPDAYPPSVLTLFENVKKEVARTRKSQLVVRPETGSASLFVDGRPMGTAPTTLSLVPGSYRVMLVNGDSVSFPHRVEMPRDSKLNVDFAFEGSVGLQPPLCISGPGDEAAVKLSQLVAAERVVVLRNVSRRGEPPYIAGVVVDLASGKQEREGAVTPELLPNLATFLITGRDVTGVQRTSDPRPVSVTVATPVPGKKTVNAEPKVELRPQPVATAQLPPPSGARIVSGSLIGAGAAAIIAGAITFAAGDADRTRFTAIAPDGALPSRTTVVGIEAVALMSKIDQNRSIAFTMMGVGGGAAVAGVVGLLLFPASPVAVSGAAGPGGASLSVAGSF